MTTQKTPGTWDSIPAGSKVRAERKGTVLTGILIEVAGHNRDKYMDVDAFPPLTTRLFAKDQWEVTYESRTLEDELDLAQVGDLFSNKEGTQELIKLSDEYVSFRQLSGGYWEIPKIRRIKDYSHVSEGVYGLRPRL